MIFSIYQKILQNNCCGTQLSFIGVADNFLLAVDVCAKQSNTVVSAIYTPFYWAHPFVFAVRSLSELHHLWKIWGGIIGSM